MTNVQRKVFIHVTRWDPVSAVFQNAVSRRRFVK